MSSDVTGYDDLCDCLLRFGVGSEDLPSTVAGLVGSAYRRAKADEGGFTLTLPASCRSVDKVATAFLALTNGLEIYLALAPSLDLLPRQKW